MGDTLQDALKVQPSLLQQRKAVEQLCITSYKMMVHVILSYPPLATHIEGTEASATVWWQTTSCQGHYLHSVMEYNEKTLFSKMELIHY